ncbi:MAG TPA: hypothetical protein VLJ21_00025 [Candidatus Binatia bacterium]|nr:hypothetical protein [Candidatus Binatia bacterium]
MKQFFWLLNDNLALATAEALALAAPSQALRIGDLLLVDSKHRDFSRIALSRAVYELLFVCHVTELRQVMQSFDWQSHYRKNFKLDIHHAPMFETKEFAGYVWRTLKNPRVNLDKPATQFELFFVGTQVIAGRRTATIEGKPFLARRPHLRPIMHPSGMQPRLARALVNLTGAWKGTITDPFCGAGGILLEAGLMGFKLVGTDIHDAQIARAKKNLAAAKLKAKLTVADATTLGKVDSVVTDLPYGLHTKGKELPRLYGAFLQRLKKNLKNRAVIVFPNFINHQKLLKQAKLRVLGEFTNYVHGSLSRTIVVVE